MNKFEEMNKNSDAVITYDIDKYLLSQGYEKENQVFCKKYYGEKDLTTLVDIKRDSVYFYREDNGFYVSDEYIEMGKNHVKDLESFKEYINELFEEKF